MSNLFIFIISALLGFLVSWLAAYIAQAVLTPFFPNLFIPFGDTFFYITWGGTAILTVIFSFIILKFLH